MRIILDYGGTVVDLIDEQDYSEILEKSDGPDITAPGYIAYKAFSMGILSSEEEYIKTLSTLTGLSQDDCMRYLEKRRQAPELTDERRQVLEDLALDHSLVLFTDQVDEWIDETLRRFGISELFDYTVVSSELGVEKPHPRGYSVSLGDYDPDDAVMVSDELNDDLVMAKTFGITTVWIRNREEEIYIEPDHIIEDLVDLPELISELETTA